MSRTARPDRALEVTIERLGGRGDGIAETPEGPVFVPNALPGEQVLVRLGKPRAEGMAASVVERRSESADRVAPACRHFGRCGGCQAQHLASPAYAAWKRDLLLDVLARRGFDDAGLVADLVLCPPERRRLRFAAIGRREGAVLGFNARNSNQVIDLAECPVADPRIAALLAPLREALGDILPPKMACDAEVVATDDCLDLLLLSRVSLNGKRRERLIAFAGEHGIGRVSFQQDERFPPEVVVQFTPPLARFGETAVAFPPGAFLQPSAAGEQALREAVQVLVPPGTLRVIELYAGCGAFGLPLAAAGFRVTAYEGEAAAIQALNQAAGRASLGGRITGHVRDLARQPLRADEMRGADLVLLDPPRSGASAQAAQTAESGVPSVVYVSCNPASFARDAGVLAGGGYELRQVIPVDQFVWTPHLELVALFQRETP
ncbi:MAG: class I SAM-dependent RNA methyltransferase [Alphaproteobacteria bacterium]|nr:class I SAM-dependent RNA methyltransferase [Alphaproteobacteria bacterium]MCB9929164.1 class I SAM-dependent RNA methyltransferase [Alphaproteobacteria bacterium]